MTNPSKAKGTAAETALLRWLDAHGVIAHRNPPSGNRDVGDLTVTALEDGRPRRVVVEVKNCRDVAAAINQGLAELDVEMANAGASRGVLVVKRRGKGDPGEWLAIRKVANDPDLHPESPEAPE